MLTFSLNNKGNSKDQILKTMNLIKGMNSKTQNYATDAYIRIVSKEGSANIDLKGFARLKEKDKKYDDAQSHDISIEDLENEPFYTTFEDEAIARADENYYKESFIKLRAYLFVNRGIDLWRLLELVVKDNDVLATRKLRNIVREEGVEAYFRDFCSNFNNLSNVARVLG